MTRNHFSKKGGPYFVNDGFTKHIPEQENIKPDKVLYKGITIAAFLLAIIGSLVSFL